MLVVITEIVWSSVLQKKKSRGNEEDGVIFHNLDEWK